MTNRKPAARTSLVLDALGDGTRRAIVDLLAERPRAVVELAEALPVTRPAVSLHLRVLRDAGLVRDRAVGTRRIYQLDREGLAMLRDYLDLMWVSALDSFAAAAEAAHAADIARGKPRKAQRARSDRRSTPKRRQ